jgi:hypothetical protein
MDAKEVAAALKANNIEDREAREEAARVEAARLYALPEAVAKKRAMEAKKRAMEAEAALGVSGCSLFVIHSLPRKFPPLREENLDDDGGGGERKGGDDGGDGTGGAAEDTGIGVRKVLKEVLLTHDQLHGSGVSSSSWMVDESEDGKKVRTRCTRSVVLWAVGLAVPALAACGCGTGGKGLWYIEQQRRQQRRQCTYSELYVGGAGW